MLKIELVRKGHLAQVRSSTSFPRPSSKNRNLSDGRPLMLLTARRGTREPVGARLLTGLGVLVACNSALGEMALDIYDLLHGWTDRPPSLDDIWPPSQRKPHVESASPRHSSWPPTTPLAPWTPHNQEKSEGQNDFGLPPGTDNHGGSVSPPLMPNGQNDVRPVRNNQELSAAVVNLDTPTNLAGPTNHPESNHESVGGLVNLPVPIHDSNFHLSELAAPLDYASTHQPNWDPGASAKSQHNPTPKIPTSPRPIQAPSLADETHDRNLDHFRPSDTHVFPQSPAVSKRRKPELSSKNPATDFAAQKSPSAAHSELTDESSRIPPPALYTRSDSLDHSRSPDIDVLPQGPALSKRRRLELSSENLATDFTAQKSPSVANSELTDESSKIPPSALYASSDPFIQNLALLQSRRISEGGLLPETHRSSTHSAWKGSAGWPVLNPTASANNHVDDQVIGSEVLKFDRLVFNANVFEDSSLMATDSMHADKIGRMSSVIKDLPEKILTLDNRRENIGAFMNRFVYGRPFGDSEAEPPRGGARLLEGERQNARQGFWMESIKALFNFKEEWLEFWEKRSGLDLHISFPKIERDMFLDNTNLFALYLFYVDMIDVVTEKNHDSAKERDLFERATAAFQKFRTTEFFQARIKAQFCNVKKKKGVGRTQQFIKHNPKSVLWYYLEYWLSLPVHQHNPSIRPRRDALFKGFFNDVFSYSIKNFHKRLLEASSEA
ncbi:hypothetical protein MJO29_009139 [Puccinia striiformis f. sp. tritici]|nr:hypothetical protein Pst134EB_018838 [Puccinia striiformis f. sp. tritici]KAI7950465.1 hypothetical protein MJO29_009139 [Puccinia striiformis f. sp. tritici]